MIAFVMKVYFQDGLSILLRGRLDLSAEFAGCVFIPFNLVFDLKVAVALLHLSYLL